MNNFFKFNRGMDKIGTFVQTSRQLKFLSLNRTRIIGNDLKKFCSALSNNTDLMALSLG